MLYYRYFIGLEEDINKATNNKIRIGNYNISSFSLYLFIIGLLFFRFNLYYSLCRSYSYPIFICNKDDIVLGRIGIVLWVLPQPQRGRIFVTHHLPPSLRMLLASYEWRWGSPYLELFSSWARLHLYSFYWYSILWLFIIFSLPFYNYPARCTFMVCTYRYYSYRFLNRGPYISSWALSSSS